MKDVGFNALARELNKKGVKSPDGLKWIANVIRRILINPTYVGDLRFGKTVSGKFHRLIDGAVTKPAYDAPRSEVREGVTLRDTHVGIY